VSLGVVQGLTEFFPVSSSGHLVLAEAVLDVNPPGVSFEVLVHLATVLSVLAVYRRRVLELAAGAVRMEGAAIRYIGLVLVASIPAALAGTTLSDAVSRLFDMPILVAFALLVTGVAVYTTRWLVNRGDRPDPGWRGSLAVGVAQALAIIPGISRSGLTVATAMAARTRREAAAEFSFLLSVPAILGASVLEAPELLSGGSGIGAVQLTAAAAAAFVAGLLAIVWFVRLLRSKLFHRFAYYCWAVGGAYILYVLIAR
jgi:undecaprenyl-diphosphatase